jgi:ribosomal protein S12 methylthiotransferase
MPPTYYLVSLGCAKNTVDSESMAALLARQGYRGTDDSASADVIIVNTCGFIEMAREESLDVLNELAAHKRPGQLLIAAGCMPQRHKTMLVERVPELDGVIGTRRWMGILDLIDRLHENPYPRPLCHLPDETLPADADERGIRRVAIQGAAAYLKIADGCRRPCAFCTIPSIKGPLVSRPPERIAEEAAHLNDNGIQEIILIAQDTTDYGHDLGMKDGLAQLLEAIVHRAPDVPWIRVMYAYPGQVTPRLIETMAAHSQIVPYLDMPLQHGHPDTLKRMRRPANIEWVYQTVESLRTTLPEIAIRTTFIVGYPGETDEEFETLLDFVRDLRFDRVGAFTYSHELGTPAADLPDQVPEPLKHERHERLMQIQQPISLAHNQALVGRTLPVLVEGCNDGVSLGRTMRDAPEIDGMVIVEDDLPIGRIIPIAITGALPYDLLGERP